jgi:serine/threonine protein kinase
MYHHWEFQELKQCIIPDGTESIPGENGIWYVLMPDHHGSLHSHVQSRRSVFTERQAQPIFKQIVVLVEFCHQIGFYLRDFKLRKFVFVDQHKTKIRLNSILDLYVAPKMEDDSLSDRCVCPAYVAPEILNMNQKTYEAKPADIWGLGVLMFILLTGHYPFFDSHPKAFFRRIKARRFSYPLSETISHPARWLLYSLLRQNPADRPTAMELLHSQWLRADPEHLPNEKPQPPKATSTQTSPTTTPTLTSSLSQPSLASSTPIMRLLLPTTITEANSASARVIPTPDFISEIDQTVPDSIPMSAPILMVDSAHPERNVFLASVNPGAASPRLSHL